MNIQIIVRPTRKFKTGDLVKTTFGATYFVHGYWTKKQGDVGLVLLSHQRDSGTFHATMPERELRLA